jgi:hypothetical protein
MKIIITENRVEILKELIKTQGTDKTIKQMGGWGNFCQVFKIEGPMDFLHLFDDLDIVQSLEEENWTLFRYKKGHNYMIYDRKTEDVYINYYGIWSFLEDKFDLNYPVVQGITKKWLGEVYNLRGVTTHRGGAVYATELGEVYNLK